MSTSFPQIKARIRRTSKWAESYLNVAGWLRFKAYRRSGVEMEKRFGPTSPSGSSEDVGAIFLVDLNGIRVVIRPSLGGKPDHDLADKILKLLNKAPVA
jgi:hypothetical protein